MIARLGSIVAVFAIVAIMASGLAVNTAGAQQTGTEPGTAVGTTGTVQSTPVGTAPRRGARNTFIETRDRINRGTVTIISGGVNGTYIRVASDLAAVLDRPNELRILPVIGKGSVQNITDILYLRGVDVGIVQSDVLSYIRQRGLHPTIERRVNYITKLYNEELHILAGPDIETLEDLNGRKVNFGVEGGGTFITVSTVFDTLGIDATPTDFDQALALEKLRNGEIAAIAYVAGKPTSLFANLVDDTGGLRFVPVPPTPELLEIYLPSIFTDTDYPNLVAEGEPVDTVAVGAVMAVYNWQDGTERYAKVERFVEAFFDEFESFQEAPRHEKWQEVNLATSVPGWTRFPPAQNWLDENPLGAELSGNAELRNMFERFLSFMAEDSGSIEEMSTSERRRLFNRFVEWQEQVQQ